MIPHPLLIEASEPKFDSRIQGPISESISLFGLGSRLDALADRSVDVVVRNPALVVGLASCGRSSHGLGAGERTVNLTLSGLLGGLGSTLSGREEGLNPSLVNKVQSTSERDGQEEVEEDTINRIVLVFPVKNTKA